MEPITTVAPAPRLRRRLALYRCPCGYIFEHDANEPRPTNCGDSRMHPTT